MRALAVLVALVSAGVACAAPDERAQPRAAPPPAETQLAITVWPQGRGEGAVRWTLRCEPVGGTLPNAGRACDRLERLERPFAPVPKDVVCAAIYGGPNEALVRGTFRDGRVWARFNRRDGCQIARWNTIRFLFPRSA